VSAGARALSSCLLMLLAAVGAAVCPTGCELIVDPPQSTRSWTFDDSAQGWLGISYDTSPPGWTAMVLKNGVIEMTVPYTAAGQQVAVEVDLGGPKSLAGRSICATIQRRRDNDQHVFVYARSTESGGFWNADDTKDQPLTDDGWELHCLPLDADTGPADRVGIRVGLSPDATTWQTEIVRIDDVAY